MKFECSPEASCCRLRLACEGELVPKSISHIICGASEGGRIQLCEVPIRHLDTAMVPSHIIPAFVVHL